MLDAEIYSTASSPGIRYCSLLIDVSRIQFFYYPRQNPVRAPDADVGTCDSSAVLLRDSENSQRSKISCRSVSCPRCCRRRCHSTKTAKTCGRLQSLPHTSMPILYVISWNWFCQIVLFGFSCRRGRYVETQIH